MGKFYQYMNEASYKGNLGFEEMAKFYQKANKQQIEELEKALKHNDWDWFKKLIKQVLSIVLV